MQIRYDERIQVRRPRSLWRDTLIGMAAGVVGTAAMGQFWSALSAVQSSDEDDEQDGEGRNGSDQGAEASGSQDEERGAQEEEGGAQEEEGPLDDVAVVGPYYREGESATEAAARALHLKAKGRPPSDEARQEIATRVHWATGMALGALYGMLRGSRRDGLDLSGGVAFGTAAWFANDEVLVPLLGLAKGPTAQPPSVHLSALGAHVVYGAATAAAAQALDRMA